MRSLPVPAVAASCAVLLVLLLGVVLLRPVSASFTTATATGTGRAAAGAWATTGTLLWAGDNSDGAAGEGGALDTVAARTPTVIADAGTFTQVATGANFACAVREDPSGGQPAGTALCWGRNGDGQLGTGASSDFAPTPQPVAGGGTWTSVATSESAACGVRTDSTLWCWGSWWNGQLGSSATVTVAQPTQVTSSLLNGWASVDGGGTRFCALDVTAGLWCWGENSTGAVGVGSTTGTSWNDGVHAPSHVQPSMTWSDVEVGPEHTCAIAYGGTYTDPLNGVSGPVAAGELFCWGENGERETGSASTAPAVTSPLRVDSGDSGRRWTGVTAGNRATCAVTAAGGSSGAGELWCWGLPPGTGTGTAPLRVPGTWTTSGITSDSPGDRSGTTCAVTAAGAMQCRGENPSGVKADGKRDYGPAFTSTLGSITWKTVSLGHRFGCGTTSTDRVACWGSADKGQLGTGTRQTSEVLRDTGAGSGPWSSLSTSGGHTCGLRGQQAWCWGSNSNGQLGTVSNSDSGTPVQVAGGHAWTQVVTGGTAFTCGLDTAGAAWCWGYTYLGQGGGGGSDVPVRVVDGAGMAPGRWLRIDSGSRASCGIRSDHSLWCWGDNGFGQLGVPGTGHADVPVRVGTGNDWTALWAGVDTPCATRSGGQLHCWGRNDRGQAGTGAAGANVGTPTVVPGVVTASVAAGNHHTCAVLAGGALRCWGHNGRGVFGDGTDGATALNPVPAATAGAGAGKHWLRVFASDLSTCAIAAEGLFCFGDNYDRMFGAGVPDGWNRDAQLIGGGPVTDVVMHTNRLMVLR